MNIISYLVIIKNNLLLRIFPKSPYNYSVLNRFTSPQFSHRDESVRHAESSLEHNMDDTIDSMRNSMQIAQNNNLKNTLGSNGGILGTTLDGLEARTDYEICIQAYNAQGYGPLSPSVTIVTKEDGQFIASVKIKIKISSLRPVPVH